MKADLATPRDLQRALVPVKMYTRNADGRRTVRNGYAAFVAANIDGTVAFGGTMINVLPPQYVARYIPRHLIDADGRRHTTRGTLVYVPLTSRQ